MSDMTLTPLAYGEDNDGWYVSRGDEQLMHGMREDDARRIVACVNACAGSSTEWLEFIVSDDAIDQFGGPRPFETRHGEVLREALRIMAERDKSEKQRDELLAALEGLHKVCEIAMSCKDGKQHTYFETSAGHFVEATKAMQEAESAISGAKGRADAPADIDDGFVGRLDDAITEALGDVMDCTRVWSAWRHGTMGEDDFALVADDPYRVMEIRDAVLKVVRATKKCACVQQSAESETQSRLTRIDETQTSIPAITLDDLKGGAA